MENQKDTENSETTEDSNRPSMSDVVRFLEGTKDPTLPPNRLLSSPPQASSSIVVPNNRYNPLSNLHVRYQLIWIKVVHKVKSRNLYDVVVTEEVEGENCMTQEREGDIIVEIRYKSIGPWGGSGGDEWDDGVFPGILQIEIARDRREICSIEIEYCGNDGMSVGWSDKHGHNPGQQTDKIVLDYPSEYLMGITGFTHGHGTLNIVAVRSISFITNKKIHGPYGVNLIAKGDSFTSGKLGKVVGFHGRSGLWLDAIGVHVEDPNI